jgi:hypothetical protein
MLRHSYMEVERIGSSDHDEGQEEVFGRFVESTNSSDLRKREKIRGRMNITRVTENSVIEEKESMGSVQRGYAGIDVVHPSDRIDKEATLQLPSNSYR